MGATSQKAAFNALEHIYRTTYTENKVFGDDKLERNEFLRSKKSAEKIRKNFLDAAIQKSKENTGRSPQKSQIYNYSLAIDCTKDTTPQEMMDSVGEWLKKTLGVEIWSIAIHKDEGYIIDHSKEPPHKMLSDSGFYYKDGSYYRRKDDTKLAENYEDLKSKFEIVRTYHAHIEFSGIRADGSSIQGSTFADRKKPRDKWQYMAHDKAFTYKLQREIYQVLNDELVKNGKEPMEIKERAKGMPKTQRLANNKWYSQAKFDLEAGFELTQEQQRTFDKFYEKSGDKARDLFKQNKAILSEIDELRAKKWNKSRAKELFNAFKPLLNEKWNEYLADIPEYDKEMLKTDRDNYFKDITQFIDTLDPKETSLDDLIRYLYEKTSQIELAKKDDIIDIKNKIIEELQIKEQLSEFELQPSVSEIFANEGLYLDENEKDEPNYTQTQEFDLRGFYERLCDKGVLNPYECDFSTFGKIYYDIQGPTNRQ